MPSRLDSPPAPCDALLVDGTAVRIRPIAGDDEARLAGFHSRLSADTIYRRFFSSHPRLSPEELHRFTHVDGHDRMALVALAHDELVGVVRYDRLPAAPDEAEVAFVVTDEYQGRGLGTLLLEHLAAYARTQSVHRFRAETLLENTAMQQVFRNAGFQVRSSFDRGVVEVEMDIRPTETFIRAVEDRDERATVNSVRHLLCPSSVAVIGAGAERGGIGHEIFRNIIEGGFPGAAYPVRRGGGSVAGRPAYRSVSDVPGPVDLAVVAVPASAVPGVIDECAAKGVRDLVVITAGFAEAGGAGRAAQDELTARIREAGMRMVGPNCMGVINTAGGISLNATFAPVPPDPGRVAFASQSGGLGIAVLQEARRRRIGLSSFVSFGNKADISGNDLVQYWHEDAGTDVILLYLESFGNPRRFARIARRVSATKPIIAVKAGRSSSGRRAASSHTAALASPDAAVDALFEQTGVIRVDTLEEMFDVAQVLSDQPVPAGRRVAIVGNAGGPGILAADACEANGLSVPELSAQSQAELRSFLPAAAAVSNPVDMVASGSADDYRRAVDVVLRDGHVDALVVVFVPPLVTQPDDVAVALSQVVAGSAKPVVANFLGMAEPPAALGTPEARIPSFCFPEAAVRALARACDYGDWRRRDPGRLVDLPDVETGPARQLVDQVLSGAPAGRWLDAQEVGRMLDFYGIPHPEFEVATDVDTAAAEAAMIGYPVALKACGPTLLHKSERGAIRLGLSEEREVRQAFAEMAANLGAEMTGVMVQAMAPAGVETIVGMVHDPAFGPLVMFGTGGTAVELFADRAFRILPLTDRDATELVESVRGARLLRGYRGSEPVDVAGLESVLLRVARMADDIDEIAEMDVNPLVCGPRGVLAVDVRIRVANAPARPDETIRRLR